MSANTSRSTSAMARHRNSSSASIRRLHRPSQPSPATSVSRFAKTPYCRRGPCQLHRSLITGSQIRRTRWHRELDITGTGAMMANFADGGKTIVVTAAPAPPPQVTQPLPPPDLHIPTQPTEGLAKPYTGPRFLVIIDPAHGGTDVGAAITPDVARKGSRISTRPKVQHELASHVSPPPCSATPT